MNNAQETLHYNLEQLKVHVFSLSTQDEQFQRGPGGWGHVTVWTFDTCDDENCIQQQLFAANVQWFCLSM